MKTELENKSLQDEIEKACEEEFERSTGYSVNEIREWREKNGYPPIP